MYAHETKLQGSKTNVIALESSHRIKNMAPGASFGRFDGESGAHMTGCVGKGQEDAAVLLLSKALKCIAIALGCN